MEEQDLAGTNERDPEMNEPVEKNVIRFGGTVRKPHWLQGYTD